MSKQSKRDGFALPCATVVVDVVIIVFIKDFVILAELYSCSFCSGLCRSSGSHQFILNVASQTSCSYFIHDSITLSPLSTYDVSSDGCLS
ncbi:hypothetical protein T02_11169 [Trichinella nativa]|uniref:Uncharacterized protein n=1 Tax=Trichinella nativa TaxID=6335 RepID=A0A0V1L1J1_9BILA|nr:hypothetical protein T02_11169 [Trichinella nativa]